MINLLRSILMVVLVTVSCSLADPTLAVQRTPLSGEKVLAAFIAKIGPELAGARVSSKSNPGDIIPWISGRIDSMDKGLPLLPLLEKEISDELVRAIYEQRDVSLVIPPGDDYQLINEGWFPALRQGQKEYYAFGTPAKYGEAKWAILYLRSSWRDGMPRRYLWLALIEENAKQGNGKFSRLLVRGS